MIAFVAAFEILVGGGGCLEVFGGQQKVVANALTLESVRWRIIRHPQTHTPEENLRLVLTEPDGHINPSLQETSLAPSVQTCNKLCPTAL